MKAVYCEKLGTPDDLVVRDIPEPGAPAEGQVKVAIEARGVAFADTLMIAGEYQGKVKVGKMDVDRNGATPMRYKVTGIPTLLVFKKGQVVEQLVG